MALVTIPSRLRELLADSPLEAPTLQFAAAASEILADNKTPFFPAYTDHGLTHVERVMDASERLIPGDVWERSQGEKALLEPADAAVLICSAILHDLALHTREAGFLALVATEGTHAPLPWFSEPQQTRAPDQPWNAAWQAFRERARHLGASELDSILGSHHGGTPPIAFGDADEDPARWIEADRLLVGDFLRRHHARLAHEIAIHGLPGVPATEFPRLGETMPELADAIGVTARSHGEDLRLMVEYCEYLHPGSRRPWGAFAPYAMGVLRIADYFQLDADRAPPLLLRLREPMSRVSIEEWNVHGALAQISWEHRDGQAIYFAASPRHGIRTHLRLRALVADIQRELDTTGAVLRELYDTPQLEALRLSRQRVQTNLDEPGLHTQLPFVPLAATLHSDKDLFRLVVGDLYGDRPNVAGREMIQNAADAVRARHRWEAEHGAVDPELLRTQSADIELRIDLLSENEAVLSVSDRGIGMTPETVRDFYLSAGATLGPSPTDFDALDATQRAEWMKAGRFGIGAFASFLLGERVEVRTRHVSADRGVSFTAELSGDVVELVWDDMPIGTEVRIPFDPTADAVWAAGVNHAAGVNLVSGANLQPRTVDFASSSASFYRLSTPTLRCEVAIDGAPAEVELPRDDVPLPGAADTGPWRPVDTDGFDAVFWSDAMSRAARSSSAGGHGEVIHNGMAIEGPEDQFDDESRFSWSRYRVNEMLLEPRVAVFDSRHLLGLTLNRYALRKRALPFEDELLESIGVDLAGWALAGIPDRKHLLGQAWATTPVFARDKWMPLLPDLVQRHLDDRLCVLWGTVHSSAFISAASARWESLPYRMETPGYYSRDHYDHLVRGHRLDIATFGHEESRLAMTRNLRLAAAVAVSLEPLSVEKSPNRQHSALGRVPAWRSETLEPNAEHGRPAHALVADLGELVDSLQELLDLGRDLSTRWEKPILLTLYDPVRDDRSQPDDDPLMRPWTRFVDGMLPRDPDELARLADELGATDPSLAAAIARHRAN